MKSYVAAVDVGTTSVKAAIVCLRGGIKGLARCATPCTTHPDGRIESSPPAIVAACLATVKQALRKSGVPPRSVQALCLTNQRATVLCMDAHGQVLGDAISWQDMRGAGQISALRRRLSNTDYYAVTGLPNNPVFTLAKILWLKSRDPERYRRTARFVLVQDYLLKQLGCREWFCDWSNAALTGLLDTGRLQWSRALLELVGLSEKRLSHLVPSARRVGALSAAAAGETGLLSGTPLVSGGGDQQCAGVGAGAVSPGILEITIGTAAVPLCCADRFTRDPHMRVMCCAHAVPGKWNLEGLQNAAGSCLQWASSLVNGGKRFAPGFLSEVGAVAPGADGIMFYPYLAGDSAPHWMPHAEGALLGLRLGHGRAQLVRAVMEGVSMQTREILDVYATLGVPIREIRLTGGCTAITAWNQIQADLYGKPVSTLENPQATLLGAAILATRGIEAYPSFEAAVGQMVSIRRTYTPDPAHAARYAGLYRRYRSVRHGLAAGQLFALVARDK